MAEYITAIRTADGDKKIDYNSLANLPKPLTLADFGITASATELNKMKGVTATTAELNYIDGATSNIQKQISTLKSTVDTKASKSEVDNLSAQIGVVSQQVGTKASKSEVDALSDQIGTITQQMDTKASTQEVDKSIQEVNQQITLLDDAVQDMAHKNHTHTAADVGAATEAHSHVGKLAWSGSLSGTNSTTLSGYANGYRLFVVIGNTVEGSSETVTVVPAAMLSTTAVKFQFADNLNYVAFNMYKSGDNVVVQRVVGSNASGGLITSVYAIE